MLELKKLEQIIWLLKEQSELHDKVSKLWEALFDSRCIPIFDEKLMKVIELLVWKDDWDWISRYCYETDFWERKWMSAGRWECLVEINTIEKLHNVMYMNDKEWKAKYWNPSWKTTKKSYTGIRNICSKCAMKLWGYTEKTCIGAWTAKCDVCGKTVAVADAYHDRGIDENGKKISKKAFKISNSF
jgi:hypothetical protein